MIARPIVALGLLFAPYALAQTSVAATALPTSVFIPAVVNPTSASVTPTATLGVAPTTSPLGTPTLAVAALGTAAACGTLRLNWALVNADPASYTVTFRAHNSGVDQAITSARSTSAVALGAAPASSAAATTTPPVAAVSSSTTLSFAGITPPVKSSAAVTNTLIIADDTDPTLPLASSVSLGIAARLNSPIRRTSLSINQTMGTNPASFGYSMLVNLPEGRYILVATIPQLGVTSSTPFTVLEGPDTSCLAAFAASSVVSSSSSPSSSLRSSTAAPSDSLAASNGGASASGSGTSTGAIVGAVVGVLAGLAIIGLVAFCLIRRKRRKALGSGSARDMQEREKAFRFGGGAAARSTSHSRRLSSEAATSTPSSRTSHTPPYARSPDTPPRIPELAAQGAEAEYDDPFATPGVSSSQSSHDQSGPTIPTIKSASELKADRRASSPIAALKSPFGPFTSAGTAYPASAALARSTSNTDQKRPSPPGSTLGEGMARRGSTKRKAVPSLGPELRKQMERNGGVAGGGGDAGRKQFALMPDMPGASTSK